MEHFFDFSISHAVWFAAVLFFASLIRGFSGFGFTAVFLTGLAFIIPVAEIVPLSIALELAASSGQARSIVRHVKWRELGLLLATGVLCTPVGIYMLGYLHDHTLRILVMAFIFASSLFLIFSHMRPFRYSFASYVLAGSAIGVINGAAALSGLVLALFLSLSDERAAQIRATMIAYLFFADLWAFSLLAGSGYYDKVGIARAAVSLPLLALGVWLGSKYFASTKNDAYKTVVFWLLLLLSSVGLLAIVIGELV